MTHLNEQAVTRWGRKPKPLNPSEGAPVFREWYDATKGLVTSSRDANDAEQIYVRVTLDDVKRPIQLDAWMGYNSVGKINMTRGQARDLIRILTEAL